MMEKLLKVIWSCETECQLDAAINYAELYKKKHGGFSREEFNEIVRCYWFRCGYIRGREDSK